ncbi:MAG: Gfo/Idh/MocA family oxidoreductase [Candidatus Hydrogenedentes bacterium]|nr:Gfo/Idh/MocA family oxidoreductase [Candidatus Hydrogenedentota bacterium]
MSGRMNSSRTRRDFLKLAAGAAIAPTILSRRAAAATPANDRIGVAIIGSGGRGRTHVGGFQPFSDAQIRVVCDVNAVNRAAAKNRVDSMYGNTDCESMRFFEAVCLRDDIDAVIIAVPDHWHALIALAAANNGKHIYLEKPFAYSIEEGKAIVDAVRKNGVVFQHGTQQRSDPNYWRACMLARNGHLGTVQTVRVGSPLGLKGGSLEMVPVPEGLEYDRWLGPAPFHLYTPGRCDGSSGQGWYHIRDYSGGWITAWGAHDVDIAHWGIGADDSGPVEVSGEAEFASDGAYDTAWRWHFDLSYANGAKVVYASEDENPHGVKFEGSEGWIFVNREKLEADPASLLEIALDGDAIQLTQADNHIGNFLDAIRNGTPVTAPLEAAHRSTNACHLCNIAAVLKRPVRWDPAKEEFVDDPEATALMSRPMREPWSLTRPSPNPAAV